MNDWPNRGEADGRSKQLLGHALGVRGRHALNLVDQLLRGKRPSVNENLAGELLGSRAAALKPGKEAHLELGLDPADLLLAEAAIGGAQELVAHDAEKLSGAVRPASCIDREHAGVGEA